MTHAPPPGTGPSPLHILVVEDEEAHAELIRRGFAHAGDRFSLTFADTVRAGREALGSGAFNLILADWLLPDGKGIDLLPVAGGVATLPLVIMTSYGDEGLAVEMIKAGAIDYIVKSDTTFREMSHVVDRALREWRHIVQRRQSEQKFHILFENTGLGIGYWDPAGRLILFNSIAASNMGGKPADYAGKTLLELYGMEDANTYLERFRIAIEDPGTRFYEDPVELPAGVRWFSSAYTAVRDEAGEVTGVQVISTDITERKQAERAQKESEARYRVLVDHVPDSIIVHRFGVIVYVNPAGTAAIGYTAEELIGTPITQYLDPACRDQIAGAMKRRVQGDDVPPYEIGVFHKSGRTMTVMVRGSMIDLQDGPAILNVLTDVTAWKAAEQALRENEERFRHISTLISDFAYSCRKAPGGAYRIDWMTGAVGKVTGYTIAEVHAMTCWKCLVIEDDLALFGEQVTGLFPGESSRCELRIRHKDGRIIWLASFAECVSDPDDPTVHRLYGGCRDITERKRADQSLLIANRKLNLMNMVAWHDIQNKLTGLWGYIELTKEMVSDAQVTKFLETEGEILSVIHQQLASTREYQQMGMEPPQWLNIGGMMRSIQLSGKTSAVTVAVEVGDLEIFGDPVIERVFAHLVENSLMHGGEVTRIRLSYQETAAGLVLIYEDNGTGIPDAIRPDLFVKSFGKTTGFDLFFVHDLLELSGMDITETGKAGEGVRFEITVPRRAYRFRTPGEGPD